MGGLDNTQYNWRKKLINSKIDIRKLPRLQFRKMKVEITGWVGQFNNISCHCPRKKDKI
jgi:hypothetical protein